MEEFLKKPENLITILTSLCALVISIVALVYTIRTYILKSGYAIRGNYGTCSSISCDDTYVASLTLENVKDKAIVIFKIYLRIGYNYFIELEDHSEKPLIISPFEVYQKNYDPILFYAISSDRIILDDLISNPKVKKQIILSTTDGQYKVRTNIKRWDAVGDFFRNYYTAIISPMQMIYKDKAYGINVKYLVEFIHVDDSLEVVPIYDGDERIAKFKKFNLTKESLESKDNLEKLFKKLKREKKLSYKEVKVIEFQKECHERYQLKKKKIIHAKHHGKFYYFILGRIYTLLEKRRLNRLNETNKLKNKAAI